jgi:3D (Asp-Asp-Asp) domain-containing protein
MNSLYRAISLAAAFWTTVSMSAYTPHETGSRTTASGARAKEGYTCAANFVPLGSIIIYEGHKYVVQDRMNPKYNRHVDIFMESHKKALQFGRKNAKVQIITPDDKQVKLPKENKHKENFSSDRNNRCLTYIICTWQLFSHTRKSIINSTPILKQLHLFYNNYILLFYEN